MGHTCAAGDAAHRLPHTHLVLTRSVRRRHHRAGRLCAVCGRSSPPFVADAPRADIADLRSVLCARRHRLCRPCSRGERQHRRRRPAGARSAHDVWPADSRRHRLAHRVGDRRSRRCLPLDRDVAAGGWRADQRVRLLDCRRRRAHRSPDYAVGRAIGGHRQGAGGQLVPSAALRLSRHRAAVCPGGGARAVASRSDRGGTDGAGGHRGARGQRDGPADRHPSGASSVRRAACGRRLDCADGCDAVARTRASGRTARSQRAPLSSQLRPDLQGPGITARE